MEAFLHEDGGTYATAPFPYADPTRNISTYLVAAGLAPPTPTPSLLDYLVLVRAQAAVAHQWSCALSVGAVDAYLRAGHSRSGHALGLRGACP